MSNRQTAESQNQPLRKRRQAEVVSFEDLLAAHQVDREPGKLPPEGVVLIGVDRELQERMRAGFPAPALAPPDSRESNFGTTILGRPLSDAPKTGEPNFGILAPSEPAGDRPLNDHNQQINPVYPAPLPVADINIAVPNSGVPDSGVPKFGEPDFSAPQPIDPDGDTTEEFDIQDLVQRRTGKKTYTIQPASRIEVILSAGELALLRWYWENGRHIPGYPHARIVSGANGEGSRRMAAQAGLVWNTFRNYTRSLSTKYAIDIVRPDSNIPRLYVVWHYTAILERLRSAGFTGVMRKNGGCRQLVDDQMRPAPERQDLTVSDLKRMFATSKSGTGKSGTMQTLTGKSGIPKSGTPNSGEREQIFGSLSGKSGMPNFDPPIRNKEYPSEKEFPTSSSAYGVPNFATPRPVIDALFERTGRTDVDAGRTIFKSCLDANPTVTPDEIARLIRGFQIPGSITNPVGLMIRTLPARCQAESLANYRQHWRQQDEQLARAREYETLEEQRIARRVLEDSETTEAEREWARGVLAR